MHRLVGTIERPEKLRTTQNCRRIFQGFAPKRRIPEQASSPYAGIVHCAIKIARLLPIRCP
jgi:hypothetical protein